MTKIFNQTILKQRRKELRNNMPVTEARLWYYLKSRQLKNYKFRRQYSVGRYILDFYCPELKTAIEIDGDFHFNDQTRIYDQARQKYLESVGIITLRFTNIDIVENIDGVINVILNNLP